MSGSCGSASTRARRLWPCGRAERAERARRPWRWHRLASPGASLPRPRSYTPRSLASARVTGGNYRESGAAQRSPGRVGGPQADARTSESCSAPWSPKEIPSASSPSGRATLWFFPKPRLPEAAFLGREGGRLAPPSSGPQRCLCVPDAKVPFQHRLKLGHCHPAVPLVFTKTPQHTPRS